jgi:hypothetical protein
MPRSFQGRRPGNLFVARPLPIVLIEAKDEPNSTRSRHSNVRMAAARWVVKDRSLRASQ